MTPITDWMKEYAAMQSFQPAGITAMKSMNYLMAIQTAVIGFLLLGPGELFLQPSSPPDSFWLAPALLGVGLWEVVFIVAALVLTLCTLTLKGVKTAHGLLAVSWIAFSSLWTIGGIITSPSYLFGVGILGIFIALQHVALIGVWRAEGV